MQQTHAAPADGMAPGSDVGSNSEYMQYWRHQIDGSESDGAITNQHWRQREDVRQAEASTVAGASPAGGRARRAGRTAAAACFAAAGPPQKNRMVSEAPRVGKKEV